jgi:hypothetical protein
MISRGRGTFLAQELAKKMCRTTRALPWATLSQPYRLKKWRLFTGRDKLGSLLSKNRDFYLVRAIDAFNSTLLQIPAAPRASTTQGQEETAINLQYGAGDVIEVGQSTRLRWFWFRFVQ